MFNNASVFCVCTPQCELDNKKHALATPTSLYLFYATDEEERNNGSGSVWLLYLTSEIAAGDFTTIHTLAVWLTYLRTFTRAGVSERASK